MTNDSAVCDHSEVLEYAYETRRNNMTNDSAVCNHSEVFECDYYVLCILCHYLQSQVIVRWCVDMITAITESPRKMSRAGRILHQSAARRTRR